MIIKKLHYYHEAGCIAIDSNEHIRRVGNLYLHFDNHKYRIIHKNGIIQDVIACDDSPEFNNYWNGKMVTKLLSHIKSLYHSSYKLRTEEYYEV